MDLQTRIDRRRRDDREPDLVRDYDAISPVAHVEEPTGRGPVFERLLDHLDPVFEGTLPPNGYLYGPPGVGKSAVVTALFDHLDALSVETRSVIHTTTRGQPSEFPGFVYVDTRTARTEFGFYHRVLDSLVAEQVPRHGISTDEVRTRLHDRLRRARSGVVVAVDHAGEAVETAALVDRFAGLPSSVSWVAVGRDRPDATDLTEYTANSIPVEPYRRRALVDVVTARASRGLSQGGLAHDLARRIAEHVDGDAHDALAVLLAAAVLATRRDRGRVREADVDEALAELPDPSVSLGRVMALPANRLGVVRALVDLGAAERESVTDAAAAVAADTEVSLSTGTVRRFLYELAESGILERVESEERGARGRPPSRLELRFPPTAFRRLYDLRE